MRRGKEKFTTSIRSPDKVTIKIVLYPLYRKLRDRILSNISVKGV